MKLCDYLELNKLTLDAFGALVGVSGVTVWRWKEGQSPPTFENLQRIHDATGGNVTFADFRSADAA